METWQAKDGHPILRCLVKHPIVELLILGKLDGASGGQGTVPVLKVGQAIGVLPDGLLDEVDSCIGVKTNLLQKAHG